MKVEEKKKKGREEEEKGREEGQLRVNKRNTRRACGVQRDREGGGRGRPAGRGGFFSFGRGLVKGRRRRGEKEFKGPREFPGRLHQALDDDDDGEEEIKRQRQTAGEEDTETDRERGRGTEKMQKRYKRAQTT